MSNPAKKGRKPAVKNETVKKATGKTLPEWFRVLDRAGAKKLNHPEIAKWLAGKKKVAAWWSQMLTVEYEYSRGLRSKTVIIPHGLRRALVNNKPAKAFFDSLAPSHRRNYAEWVAEAKKPETRASRIKEAVRLLQRKRPER